MMEEHDAEMMDSTAATATDSVCRLEDVPEGTMLMVQVDGTDILVVNRMACTPCRASAATSTSSWTRAS